MFVWKPFRGRLPALFLARPEDELYRRLEERAPEFPAGLPVAVGVGSRALANYRSLTATILEYVRERGREAFLLPAMGSHGGGLGHGQRRILAGYGLSPAELGVEVRGGGPVRVVGQLPDGRPVYLSEAARTAGAVILLNRVKPHTVLDGPPASGLQKMLTVGLGQAPGAASLHQGRLWLDIPAAAQIIRRFLPHLYGVALIENGYHRPARIEVLPASEFAAAEARLLPVAAHLMARLPPVPIDLLLIDRMGKDVAGTGMDPHVIGLWRRRGGPRRGLVRWVAVLGLSPRSRGNASGIGMADFTTRGLLAEVDWRVTGRNAETAGFRQGARPPRAFANAAELLAGILPRLGDRPRVVRVRSTLELEEIWASEALWPELSSGWRAIGEARPPEFDDRGNLSAFEKGIWAAP